MHKKIAIRLYNNTEEMYLNSSSSIDRAKQSIAFEELGVISSLRDKSLDVKNLRAAIAFIERTGIDYQNMYIIGRVDECGETRYQFGYTDKDNVFEIVTQIDGNVIHTCIIMAIEI